MSDRPPFTPQSTAPHRIPNVKAHGSVSQPGKFDFTINIKINITIYYF